MPEATKNVLMTGTSSGIGSAASTAAAQAGRRVIATMRDLRRADGLRDAAKAAGVSELVEPRILDVTDPAAAAACIDGGQLLRRRLGH